MATLNSALQFARAQAQTDSNGLTDTNGIIFANESLLDFRRELITAGVDANGIQEAYRSGTANTGTYLYPTSPQMWFLKAIEVNYASTTPEGYRRASQVDSSNLDGGISFSFLRTNADPYNPQFDDHGDWFEIFPTPTGSDNLTDMMRILYFAAPTEFTTVNDSITYPESLDYRILGWRIAANYKRSLTDFNSAAAFDAEYARRVKDIVDTLGRGSQQPIQASIIPWNGFEF